MAAAGWLSRARAGAVRLEGGGGGGGGGGASRTLLGVLSWHDGDVC